MLESIIIGVPSWTNIAHFALGWYHLVSMFFSQYHRFSSGRFLIVPIHSSIRWSRAILFHTSMLFLYLHRHLLMDTWRWFFRIRLIRFLLLNLLLILSFSVLWACWDSCVHLLHPSFIWDNRTYVGTYRKSLYRAPLHRTLRFHRKFRVTFWIFRYLPFMTCWWIYRVSHR